MKVRYTPQAKSDLTEIFAHIAQDNPRAARGVITTIGQDIAHLADNPRWGRPGRVAGTRELVASEFPYVAAYRIAGRPPGDAPNLRGAQQSPLDGAHASGPLEWRRDRMPQLP